jgi:hypothetical protein
MVKSAMLVWGVLGLLGLSSGPERQAPRVWKTDLRIRSFDVMPVGQGSLQATVGIIADGDDAARAARLELLLPVSVGLIRAPAGCRPSPAAVGNLTGRVTCELGDIPGRGVREITVLTSAPTPHTGARFAAMVLSDTPDVTPSNNFAERESP